jgi:serine protease Do
MSALSFPLALLGVIARVSILALVLVTLTVRFSITLTCRALALRSAAGFRAAATLYLIVLPALALWHGDVLAADAGGSLAHMFKRVDKAVVVIRTAGHAAGPWAGQTVTTSGIGSGVLISAAGDVLTAAHVVQTADAVGVEFPGGEIVRAAIVASDSSADVALLRLEHVPKGVQPAALGDSDEVEVGDQVFVIGAPLGISHTLTVGHISARRAASKGFGPLAAAELFQTDAAINQGNSGGPMFNLAGEVIGVVSHIVSRSGGSDGLGFVVTSNAARRLVIDEPSVWTGLEGVLLTNDVARAFNLPGGAAGLLVQRIAEGSPAQRFGLRAGALPIAVGEDRLLIGGDVILAVEGISLGAPDAYEQIRHRLIALRDGGNPIRVTVLRGGETIELAGAI